MAKNPKAEPCFFDGHNLVSLVSGSEAIKAPGTTAYTLVEKHWIGCGRCGRTLDEIRAALAQAKTVLQSSTGENPTPTPTQE